MKIFSYYSENIEPIDNVIFVFGSNTEGRHGKGAAKIALDRFGAKYGQAEGLQGNSYAIITKDLSKDKRSIKKSEILKSIKKLYSFAENNPKLLFCIAYRNLEETSLSGYTGIEMIELFNSVPAPHNILFSYEWINYINKNEKN